MKDEELDQLFREARAEPWPEERLRVWRQTVMQPAEKRPLGWWRWVTAPALAGSVALALVYWVPAGGVEPLPYAIPHPEVTSGAWKRVPRSVFDPPLSVIPRLPVPEQPPDRASLPLPLPDETAETEFLRIYTSDPEVVILWALNGNGK